MIKKISIGIMAFIVLFAFTMFQYGEAFAETGHDSGQGVTIEPAKGRLVGDGPGIGDEAPHHHPDKIKEKEAVAVKYGKGEAVTLPVDIQQRQ